MPLINFSELNIQGSDSNNYSRVHISNPQKTLQRFGKLGLIISAELPVDKDLKQKIKDKFQEFIDLSVNSFYNNKKNGKNQEKEFEELLQEANNWIQSQKQILEEVTELDITIINSKEENLFFSQIGNIGAYLESDRKLIEISQKNNDKKFSDIVQGTLKRDNKLLITSKNIFDHFSSEKINQIIQNNSSKKALEQIQKLLPDTAENDNFIGSLLELQEKTKDNNEKKSEIIQKKEEEKKAKEEERKKEEKKQEEIKKKEEKEKRAQKEKEKEENKKAPIIKPNSSHFNNKINTNMANKISQNKGKNRNKARFITLIVIIIFACLFVASIFIINNKKTAQKEKEEYTALVNKLEEKKEEFTAALIAEESSAKTKLSEIKTLLNKLPKETKNQKELYNQYYSSYQSGFYKLYNITSIEEPKIIADLSQISENSVKDIAKIGNNIYILGSRNNYIYRYNFENNQLLTINKTSKNISLLSEISKLDNDNLLGENNNNLGNFNVVDKKLEPLTIDTKHQQAIKDVVAYNNKIYTLEPSNNQIYKYSRSIQGFSKEEAWLKDSTNLQDGLSIAIDGSIYVLSKGGNMIKLYTGKKTEFNNPQFTPPISLSAKLMTNYDMSFVYLLDPPSKRLIQISKQGSIRNQFTSPKFKKVKDFIISEDENTAWILSGTNIYEIEI